MYKIKLSPSFFLVVILISLAVSPAFALGEGNRNILLIGVMGICPILMLNYRQFYRSEIWLLLFMISIILIPLLNQPASMRWSTVLYSFMFGLTFMAYGRLLHRKSFTVTQYLNLLKYLIYAYAIVLLIQQFCVLTGLPIFNVSNYYPPEPWKLNSLAAEPSHSARIVALLMYCYIVIKELVSHTIYNFRSNYMADKWVWIAFIWTMITMGSGTAFLFIGIVLLKFIRIKTLIPLFTLLIIIIVIFKVTGIGTHNFERTYKVIEATATFDVETIMKADHSASLRIVPMMIVSQMVDFTTTNGWFGHGIDYTSSFLSDVIPGLPKGSSGGAMFQIWMEYGFLSFLFFLLFSIKMIFKKGDILTVVFWFLLVFMYGVNSQIVWLCIALLYTNRYFSKKDTLIRSIR